MQENSQSLKYSVSALLHRLMHPPQIFYNVLAEDRRNKSTAEAPC